MVSEVRENMSFIPPYGFLPQTERRTACRQQGRALFAALHLRQWPEAWPRPLHGVHLRGLREPCQGPKGFVKGDHQVGSYYQTAAGMQALDGLVNDDYDRAAPLGCGDCKAAGNYAADLESMHAAKRPSPLIIYPFDGFQRCVRG